MDEVAAFVKAAEVYRREPCARPLWKDLEAHLVGGYVMSRPDAFLMGRQVRSDWTDEQLLDPRLVDRTGDAWHVWLAAGRVRDLLAMAPHRLPWLTWERRGRIIRRKMGWVEAVTWHENE